MKYGTQIRICGLVKKMLVLKRVSNKFSFDKMLNNFKEVWSLG